MSAAPVKPIGWSTRLHHGFHTATPYLVVKAASDAIAFYKNAFGATELSPPLKTESGKIVHAELRIGDSPIMLTDEFPEWNQHGPAASVPILVHLYVEDADAVFHQAIAAGAKVAIPLGDQFYGARSGRVTDPFGHIWIIETQKEEVAPQELSRRLREYLRAATSRA